jgi:hypothetical protein
MNPLLKKTEKLIQKPEGSLNTVDIDYEVLSDPDDPWTVSTRSLEEVKYNAILNAYRLWLNSDKYDYIREPDIGGLFQNHLNDKVQFSTKNEDKVKEILINLTNEVFPNIEIVECNVTAVINKRQWKIEVIVKDKTTDMVTQITNAYSVDSSSGESE